MKLLWLIFLVPLGAVLLLRLRKKAGTDEKNALPTPPQESCTASQATCGITCHCNAETLRKKMQPAIEYYEDEELDRYKGVNSTDYNDTQTAEFSEVLTTLRPQEVGSWLQSLEKRGIQLPASLRDETLMLMNETS